MTASDLVRLVADSTAGWSFGCTRTGATHLREGKGCQDAYGTWAGSAAGRPYMIAAVADGHGDVRHDRSAAGASSAVRAAVAELTDLFLHFGCDGGWTALCQAFREDFPRRVGRHWRQAVEADAVRLSTDPPPTRVEPYVRYGTTLLVALAAGDSVLVGQLGDGDIVLVRDTGEVERPVPTTPSEGGTATDSLCSPDSHRLWRTAAIERTGRGLLLLASDGLVNAFPDQGGQWFRFARALGDRVAEFGPARVAGSLPSWLDHCSAAASGDDITLVVMDLASTRSGGDLRHAAGGEACQHSPPAGHTDTTAGRGETDVAVGAHGTAPTAATLDSARSDGE